MVLFVDRCRISEVSDVEALYDSLMNLIVQLGSYGVIHGDFNEFNIMVTEDGKPVVIDFPQMTSTCHTNARMSVFASVCVFMLFTNLQPSLHPSVPPSPSPLRTCKIHDPVRKTSRWSGVVWLLLRAVARLRPLKQYSKMLLQSSSSMGQPIAMHLSFKGHLHTPEAHHEAYQSTASAVLQTAKVNQSGPPGEIHHPCLNYQTWPTTPLLLQGSQRAGVSSFLLLVTHSTEQILPKDTDSEDASSGDYVP
ncbi:Serine/threonine-protein kinase RIO2 [Homalodisca vitripennis]|nr:Serine/threonine-protein kinase RIO2 [Homalodisca vitripennis]